MTAPSTASRRRRRVRATLACTAALAGQLAACQTWRPLPGTLEQNAREEEIPRAHVVLRDSTVVDLRNVVIGRDSVIGFAEYETRVSIAQALVARVETRRTSVGRTIGLVGGVLAVVALVGLIALAKAFSESFTAAPSPAPAAP